MTQHEFTIQLGRKDKKIAKLEKAARPLEEDARLKQMNELEKAARLALEALEKALRYHGVMLLSDPPQDAWKYHRVEQIAHEAITTLTAALEQPAQAMRDATEQATCKQPLQVEQPAQQESVVFYRCKGCGHAYEEVAPSSCDCMDTVGFERVDYYTRPQAREPLTDDEIDALALPPSGTATVRDLVRIIEAAHGIGEKK